MKKMEILIKINKFQYFNTLIEKYRSYEIL